MNNNNEKLLVKFLSHRYLNQFDSDPIRYHIFSAAFFSLALWFLIFFSLSIMTDGKECDLYFKINDIYFAKKDKGFFCLDGMSMHAAFYRYKYLFDFDDYFIYLYLVIQKVFKHLVDMSEHDYISPVNLMFIHFLLLFDMVAY